MNKKNILNDKNLFETIYDKFSLKLNDELLEQGLTYFYSKKDLVTDMLDDLIKTYNNFLQDSEVNLPDESLSKWKKVKIGEFFTDEPIDESGLYQEMCYSFNQVKNIKSFLDNISNDKVKGNFEYVYKKIHKIVAADKPFEWNPSDKENKVIKKLNEYSSSHLDLLPKEKKRNGIETAINDYYSEVGAYFRIFHRIIKYINDKVTDEDIRKDYLGFLRATINEKELLVIFYNAAYTERGSGLLEEISKTTFFGESQELEENKTVQHFNPSLLIWKSKDLETMRNFGQKSPS